MSLTAPLDDAALLYRAQAYDPGNTVIPNEGTRPEPLILGATTGSEASDPSFASDALGDYLQFVGGADYARAEIPAAQLNGDFTFAMRYRPDSTWTIRFLATIMDQNPERKHFMVHVQSNNTVMARVWDNTPTRAQVGVVSSGSLNTNTTYTIAASWNEAAKTLKLYVDGALVATTVHGSGRSNNSASPLYIPFAGNWIAGKLFSVAWWNATKSDADMAALATNADWLSGGDPVDPPPPPPPPIVTELFEHTVIADTTVVVKENGVTKFTSQPGAVVEVEQHEPGE